jgi:hypothetical protein
MDIFRPNVVWVGHFKTAVKVTARARPGDGTEGAASRARVVAH